MANEEIRERNKELVLETAYDLFLKHGINNTTKEMIVRASGVSRSSLDRYFPSRSDYVLEVAKMVDQTIGKKYTSAKAILLHNNAETGFSMLKEYMELVRDMAYSEPKLFILGTECRSFVFWNLDENETNLDKLRYLFGSSDMLRKLIARGISDGSIKPDIAPDKEAAVLRESLIGFLASISLSGEQALFDKRSLSDYFIESALARYKA